MENQFNSKSTKSVKILGKTPDGFLQHVLSEKIELIDFNTNELRTTDKNLFSFIDEEHLLWINSLLQSHYKNSSTFSDLKSSKFKDTSTENYLKKISLESNTIDEFLFKILQHKNFKNFETIFLFVHPKGELTSIKHEVSQTYQRQSLLNVKEFNHFFQAIKKSKNRSFGQNELKGNTFNILGTFIAREFSLTFHNIIFIISRNDFLPPTDEELTIFQEFSKSFPFFLNTFLYSHLETFKKEISYKIQNDLFKNLHNMDVSLNEQTDIFHTERLNLLGELLNTLRHELSNPLFGLQLSSQILKEDFSNNPDNLEFLEEIIKNIMRSQDIIKNFSDLFIEKNLKKDIDLKEVIEEVITLTKSETRGINKEIIAQERIKLKINATFLVQVLFNLIINSAQELQRAQTLSPNIKIYLNENQKGIIIDIIDNGPGIAKEKIDEIFKPFYTTKIKGTGLGLSISSSMIQKLNGKLTCEEYAHGAHFKIQLPRNND